VNQVCTRSQLPRNQEGWGHRKKGKDGKLLKCNEFDKKIQNGTVL